MDHRSRSATLVALALSFFPLGALAEPTPHPAATNAIPNTQAGIHRAKQQQAKMLQAQSRHPGQHVAGGGTHSTSENPRNPGATKNGPGPGPGMGGGNPQPAHT